MLLDRAQAVNPAAASSDPGRQRGLATGARTRIIGCDKEAAVERRRLPGTSFDLSVVGFGCWAIGGTWWGGARDDDAVQAIHAALDCGIDWFDTAPVYGHGHADEILARALGSSRRSALIATKVGVRWDGPGAHARSDLRPEHVRADCEASLARLGVERIPLLQVHWPCELGTPLDDTLGALVRLREEGKIEHFGLCNYGAAEMRRAALEAGAVSLQTPWSLVRREASAEIAPASTLEPGRFGVLAYEPLCRGLLTGKYKAAKHFPKADLRAHDDRFSGLRFLGILRLVMRLEPIAERAGVPLAALAIGWVCRQSGVVAALAGARSAAQVRDNAVAGYILDQERLWEAVDRRVAQWTP
jgi:aryl-alcohol dehydrogenase-like predicted oxidoreductase